MEAITVRELLEAVNGTLLGSYADLDRTVDRVDTDSRSVHEGALFIPLVGERFDGHAYINSALEAGAAGCLTARERTSYQEGKFYIKVGNTQRALRDLAAWYKNRFQIPFVGVTGSVGKTTAKDMIAAVLSVKYKVLKTEGNFNNNIGLRNVHAYRLAGGEHLLHKGQAAVLRYSHSSGTGNCQPGGFSLYHIVPYVLKNIPNLFRNLGIVAFIGFM